MNIRSIVRLINRKLAGDHVPDFVIISFMDEVIDEINRDMNTIFPTFTELYKKNAEGAWEGDYDAIPDTYLRTVVVYGAAAKWYSMDEEGIAPAEDFESKYREHKFYMVRDYVTQVPPEYEAVPTGHFNNDEDLRRGIWAGDIWENLL